MCMMNVQYFCFFTVVCFYDESDCLSKKCTNFCVQNVTTNNNPLIKNTTVEQNESNKLLDVRNFCVFVFMMLLMLLMIQYFTSQVKVAKIRKEANKSIQRSVSEFSFNQMRVQWKRRELCKWFCWRFGLIGSCCDVERMNTYVCVVDCLLLSWTQLNEWVSLCIVCGLKWYE